MQSSENKVIYLDGTTLTTEQLYNIGYKNYKVSIDSDVEHIISKGRKVIDDIVDSNKTVYGINTGFGNFANVPITQENVKQSHSSGVGTPLTPERTRMLFALRINILAKGYSGISLETVKRAIAILNANCLPVVPERGTVGASGDLAPLSHLALGLMGEGNMYEFNNSDQTISKQFTFTPSAQVLKRFNLKPIELGAKEGLALINGTQLITSLGSESIQRAKIASHSATIIAAMTFEALAGITTAYHEAIHKIRPHTGQIKVARALRSILEESGPSEIPRDPKKVQDSYTLRCIPQVHGIVFDTIDFVERILTTEINSATDNPIVFSDIGEKGTTMSGGNFHGEYPAKALDYLAIGVQELANISERRMERLVNSQLSEGLPPFLVKEGGLNSGFMIAHCTAAALTSENKTLCHPSSIDTISTSAAKEDHVSMGGWSARKSLQVIENVEYVLAIELLSAVQAIDLRRPYKTTKPLEAVYQLVRSKVSFMESDRYLQPDIEAVFQLIRNGSVLDCVNSFVKIDD
eukprot:gene1958-2402_t